jgi:hypothetical protein
MLATGKEPTLFVCIAGTCELVTGELVLDGGRAELVLAISLLVDVSILFLVSRGMLSKVTSNNNTQKQNLEQGERAVVAG